MEIVNNIIQPSPGVTRTQKQIKNKDRIQGNSSSCHDIFLNDLHKFNL